MENKYLDFLETKGYSKNDVAQARLDRYLDFYHLRNSLYYETAFLNVAKEAGTYDYEFLMKYKDKLLRNWAFNSSSLFITEYIPLSVYFSLNDLTLDNCSVSIVLGSTDLSIKYKKTCFPLAIMFSISSSVPES